MVLIDVEDLKPSILCCFVLVSRCCDLFSFVWFVANFTCILVSLRTGAAEREREIVVIFQPTNKDITLPKSRTFIGRTRQIIILLRIVILCRISINKKFYNVCSY